MFSSADFEEVVPGHDDRMVISAKMVNAEVKRVFIDQGSSADIIFWDAFNKLELKNFDLQSYKEELVGFSREKVYPDRFVTLHVTLGNWPKSQTVKVNFLAIDCPSAYNVILGRPTLNKIGAIVSTACLTMKFFTDVGKIAIVKADQITACKCYNASLKVVRKKETKEEKTQPPSLSNVMLIDLDVWGRQESKMAWTRWGTWRNSNRTKVF